MRLTMWHLLKISFDIYKRHFYEQCTHHLLHLQFKVDLTLHPPTLTPTYGNTRNTQSLCCTSYQLCLRAMPHHQHLTLRWVHNQLIVTNIGDNDHFTQTRLASSQTSTRRLCHLGYLVLLYISAIVCRYIDHVKEASCASVSSVHVHCDEHHSQVHFQVFCDILCGVYTARLL